MHTLQQQLAPIYNNQIRTRTGHTQGRENVRSRYFDVEVVARLEVLVDVDGAVVVAEVTDGLGGPDREAARARQAALDLPTGGEIVGTRTRRVKQRQGHNVSKAKGYRAGEGGRLPRTYS